MLMVEMCSEPTLECDLGDILNVLSVKMDARVYYEDVYNEMVGMMRRVL
jgi:hypothetical protein